MNTFAHRLMSVVEATREPVLEIARGSGIPAKRIVDLFGGDEPREHEATKLAEFFNCDVVWLLQGRLPEGTKALVHELELASVDAVDGVVTLKPDDFRRIHTLASMGRR